MSLPSYNQSIISAVMRAQQGIIAPSFVMGGKGGAGGTTYQLFKKNSSMVFSLMRFAPVKPSSPFIVKEILIPLSAKVASNVQIIPVLYFDSEDSSSVGTTINPTNYSNSENFIKLTADNFPNGCAGQEDCFLELQFSGSALLPVSLPITIFVETLAAP